MRRLQHQLEHHPEPVPEAVRGAGVVDGSRERALLILEGTPEDAGTERVDRPGRTVAELGVGERPRTASAEGTGQRDGVDEDPACGVDDRRHPLDGQGQDPSLRHVDLDVVIRVGVAVGAEGAEDAQLAVADGELDVTVGAVHVGAHGDPVAAGGGHALFVVNAARRIPARPTVRERDVVVGAIAVRVVAADEIAAALHGGAAAQAGGERLQVAGEPATDPVVVGDDCAGDAHRGLRVAVDVLRADRQPLGDAVVPVNPRVGSERVAVADLLAEERADGAVVLHVGEATDAVHRLGVTRTFDHRWGRCGPIPTAVAPSSARSGIRNQPVTSGGDQSERYDEMTTCHDPRSRWRVGGGATYYPGRAHRHHRPYQPGIIGE